MSGYNTRHIPFTTVDPATFDYHAARKDILQALQAGVQRVHRHPSSKPSVYIGSAGVILTDWYISTLPEIAMDPPSAYAFNLPLAHPPSASHTGFLETSTGPATLMLIQALRDLSDGGSKEGEWEPCVQVLKDAVNLACNEPLDPDGDGCEVLYGRAGLLYALLRLRDELLPLTKLNLSNDQMENAPLVIAVRRLTEDSRLKRLVDDILGRGRAGARAYRAVIGDEERKLPPPSLMWSWHGKRYLGAAHGVAGILHMLILAPKSLLEPHWPDILHTVSWLLDIQLPSGNWPSKAGSHMSTSAQGEERDQLVQWCHGAPGVLLFLSSFLRRFAPHQQGSLTVPSGMLDTLQRALSLGSKLVYTHGFLRKGVGLCHGVAGCVYALLAISDALSPPTSSSTSSSTSNNNNNNNAARGQQGREPRPTSEEINVDKHFFRALHLAHLAVSYESLTKNGMMSVPDRPYSLYEGLAGMCCAWAEVTKRVDRVLTGRGEGAQRKPRGCGMPGYDDLSWADER